MSKLLYLYQYLVLFVMVAAQTKLKSALVTDFIIPDLLTESPKGVVFVIYPNGIAATLGNKLRESQVSTSPRVVWKPRGPYKLYTLAMIDIDVPTHVDFSLATRLHWLVGNIPGKRVAAGQVLASYLPPQPQEETGVHRFIFLLYEQQNTIQFIQVWAPGDAREKFNIHEFATMYGMGEPVAINFFQTRTVKELKLE